MSQIPLRVAVVRLTEAVCSRIVRNCVLVVPAEDARFNSGRP